MHPLFVIATTLMVNNISTTAGDDFVHISWSQPKFLPTSYRVEITCWLMHTETEYVFVKLEGSPFHTMFTMDKLFPESCCVFTLRAIYNPASIDDGITRAISTLNSCVYV